VRREKKNEDGPIYESEYTTNKKDKMLKGDFLIFFSFVYEREYTTNKKDKKLKGDFF
jgi:hypothetical protein